MHKISNNNCFVLSDELKLIHTFIHSQLNHKGFLLKSISLRDFYDTYLLSKKVNTSDILNQIEERKKAEYFFNYVDQLMLPTLNNSSLVIENCIIEDNQQQTNPLYSQFNGGGGLSYEGGNLTVLNCIFRNNQTEQNRKYGGGLHIHTGLGEDGEEYVSLATEAASMVGAGTRQLRCDVHVDRGCSPLPRRYP